jgi:hypothetical protein
MYQCWKRYAAESCLLYTVENMAHFCWNNPSEIKDMANPEGRHLYSCLRCGRSHMCSPPEFLTCPRMPSPSNPNMFVCPFSGQELSLISVGSLNSSFDNRELTLAAMREVFAAKAAIKNEKRLGKRIGMKMARRLRRGANQSASSTTRNTMRNQADEAQASGLAMQKVRKFEHFSKAYKLPQQQQQQHHLALNWKRELSSPLPSMPNEDDMELEQQRHRIVNDMTLSSGTFYEDDAMTNNNKDDNHDGDDDDGDTYHDAANASGNGALDPLWFSPVVVIPRLEMEADNAYYQDYLTPVAAFLKSRPDLTSVFSSSSSSSSSSLQKQQQQQSKPFEKRTWRLLPLRRQLELPRNEREEIAPHQLEVQHYMKLFVNHFTPLLSKESKASACDPFIYAQLCDRFLWLFHMHVVPISPAHHSKKNGGGGGGSVFDPNGPALPRLLFTLLTLIFTQPGYARDSVTDAKLVVWFPDPWLQACSNAGLFSQEAGVPHSLLPQSQKGTVNLTHIYDALMSILKIPSLSPQTLYTFFSAVFSL